MERIINYIVTDEENGIKTEVFLKKRGFSRHLITKLKNTENGLTLDGKLIFTTKVLTSGDLITIRVPSDVSSENIVPKNLSFNIVYEDEDLIVVNKPSNMPIHPSQGNFENTLANAVAFYYQNKGEEFVYRSINRLDRNTTGLLILAKNPLSACFLSNMMKKREIKREYLAITQGKTHKDGIINAPIQRVHESTIERCVDFENGAKAITHYKRILYKNGVSLVSIRLETGRTHQIRVHFKHIGHPLLGDFLYNPDFSKIDRQTLHSYKLSFTHPITKELMEFTCPLPEDMKKMLN